MNFEAFFRLTYGLYIVTAKSGDKMTGHISNTVFQVTAEPPRVAVCTNKNNYTTDLIDESGIFAVSMIAQNVDLPYIGRWGFKSGREIDKFDGVDYRIGKAGAPIILDKIIASLECKVLQRIDIDTHVMFIAECVEAESFPVADPPLTYAYYREVIKGISPKNAPTYHAPTTPVAIDEAHIDDSKSKYKCTVCGYVYDPATGDPSEGIAPGTAFEDLPHDWICPICSVGKDLFDEM